MLVNVVDVPPLCNFILPAILRSGPLAIAISTAGASPALAKRMKREIGEQFGEHYARLAVMLNDARGWAKATLPTFQDRSDFFESIVSGEPDPIALLRDGDEAGVLELIEAAKSAAAASEPPRGRANLRSLASDFGGSRARTARRAWLCWPSMAMRATDPVASAPSAPQTSPSLFGEPARGADVTSMRPMPARRLARCVAATAVAAAGDRVHVAVASAAQVGVNRALTTTGFSAPRSRPRSRRQQAGLGARVHRLEPDRAARGSLRTQPDPALPALFTSLPAGTKVDVDVVGCPPGPTAARLDRRRRPSTTPTTRRFLNYLVNAFHGRVTAWEIWNEEASTNWWTGTPAQFASLLEPPTRRQVRRPQRRGRSSAPTTRPSSARSTPTAPATTSTRSPCTPTRPATWPRPTSSSTTRTRTRSTRPSSSASPAIHALMAANGDGAKPICMTEIGWSTTTAECNDRRLGRPEARRRHPDDAGHLPAAGLPLPGTAAVLIRAGGDVVRALQRRHHHRPTRQLRPAERGFLAQAVV